MLTSQELNDLIGRCVSKFYRDMQLHAPEMDPHISREELQGQAYLLVCEVMEDLPSDKPMNFFLVRVISNGLQNFMRKEIYQRTGRLDQELSEALKFEVVHPDTELLDLRLSLETKDLSEEERDIVKGITEGYTYEEVGYALGMSRQAVNKKIQKLKKRFDK